MSSPGTFENQHPLFTTGGSPSTSNFNVAIQQNSQSSSSSHQQQQQINKDSSNVSDTPLLPVTSLSTNANNDDGRNSSSNDGCRSTVPKRRTLNFSPVQIQASARFISQSAPSSPKGFGTVICFFIV